MTTATIEQPIVRAVPRSRLWEIWRIVRLHAVTPSVFFGIPWIILGGAWAVMMTIGIIVTGAGGPRAEMMEGMRYSWAVLSPQWYLVAVGVQTVGMTFSFALGFGATRRDFWLGTALLFVMVSAFNAVALATLGLIEAATDGWWIGISMFESLWYAEGDWLADFYTTFALQLFVLFIGATVTTVYLRWRMRGMLVLSSATVALVLAAVALITFTQTWAGVVEWFAGIGIIGAFTMVLALAAVFALVGYIVIRRSTAR